MKNAHERITVGKLCAIETAEQYLIARTREELGQATGNVPAENLVQALYRPVLAIGLTIAFVWFLQIELIGDFLAATV